MALEGRTVQLEQQLAATQNRLHDALDAAARLKNELLEAKHEVRGKAFELAKLQVSVRYCSE